MLKIQKAVITAAGPGQGSLALQTLVDRDGNSKPVLEILVAEMAGAGVAEAGLVIMPEDRAAYKKAVSRMPIPVRLIEQPRPEGYGHALFCAREFLGGEAFFHIVGDHLCLSRESRSCARQLIDVAGQERCSVSAVQSTEERNLPYFGAVGGKRMAGESDLYEVERVLEKPTPTQAEQTLTVPGLRAGRYLCFFGMHVLTNSIFPILEELLSRPTEDEKTPLSSALQVLASNERYLAFELAGSRFNLGVRFGIFYAQLALAMEGKDRDEVLTHLVEMLAARRK